MNQFETYTQRVIGGYRAFLRTPADAFAKPIMSKGGRPELFPNKLAAVEAVMLHLVRYVNGHLYRHGEVAGETAATADAAFNQILKQKGKTRVITVAYRGKSSRCQRK